MIDKMLLSYVKDNNEITNCLKTVDCHFDLLLKRCYNACVQPEIHDTSFKFYVETVLDFLHNELNTGHWSEVPLDVRYAFQAASFIKALLLTKTCAVPLTVDILKEALKAIDLGLLLGAPLPNNSDLLIKSATLLSSEIQSFQLQETGPIAESPKNSVDDTLERFPGKTVTELKRPALETFHKFYFAPQIPVKLQGGLEFYLKILKYLFCVVFRLRIALASKREMA